MGLSVGVANPGTLNQSAPVQQNHISGVISATPGSNGFAGLTQPSSGPVLQNAAAAPAAAAAGGASSSGTPMSEADINTILSTIGNAVATNNQAAAIQAGINAGDDAQSNLDYDGQVQSNQADHGTAIQNAEQAAASGGQGLRAILASMGALGGTGQILANRAVGDSANDDIGGADTTYQDNANTIDEARKQYQTAASDRDATLQTNLGIDNEDAQHTAYQTILNAANNQGDKATYAKYLPLLAQSTAPTQAIVPQTVLHDPAAVNTYAPTSGLTVGTTAANASSTTPVNSALYVKKNS
jgi:hypothetical protein